MDERGPRNPGKAPLQFLAEAQANFGRSDSHGEGIDVIGFQPAEVAEQIRVSLADFCKIADQEAGDFESLRDFPLGTIARNLRNQPGDFARKSACSDDRNPCMLHGAIPPLF